jgi:hypothetical protein
MVIFLLRFDNKVQSVEKCLQVRGYNFQYFLYLNVNASKCLVFYCIKTIFEHSASVSSTYSYFVLLFSVFSDYKYHL